MEVLKKNLLRVILGIILATGPAFAHSLTVVASFSILGDLVHQIGKEKVQVTSLVGPNEDAHVFHPTPLTQKRLAQADLIVMNGLSFEGWLERLLSANPIKGKVVIASKDVVPRVLMATKGEKGLPDPHGESFQGHRLRRGGFLHPRERS